MKTAANRSGKVVTNERTYPFLVEIPVAAAGLDIALNRQIVEFHKSRRIQLRHGRTILKDGETYYRWCFPDFATAHAFRERFGGTFNKLVLTRDEARRIAANIAKLPELLRKAN